MDHCHTSLAVLPNLSWFVCAIWVHATLWTCSQLKPPNILQFRAQFGSLEYMKWFFCCIATFEAPYRWTSIKGGAHTCITDASGRSCISVILCQDYFVSWHNDIQDIYLSWQPYWQDVTFIQTYVAVPCRNQKLFRRVFRLLRCLRSAISLNFC